MLAKLRRMRLLRNVGASTGAIVNLQANVVIISQTTLAKTTWKDKTVVRLNVPVDILNYANGEKEAEDVNDKTVHIFILGLEMDIAMEFLRLWKVLSVMDAKQSGMKKSLLSNTLFKTQIHSSVSIAKTG